MTMAPTRAASRSTDTTSNGTRYWEKIASPTGPQPLYFPHRWFVVEFWCPKGSLLVDLEYNRLTRPLPTGLRRRVEPFIAQFIETLLALVRQPRLMLTATAFTAVAVSLDATFCLLAFKAVGVSVSLPVVLYGYTFFNLAFILPTPPGQVGSNELIGLLLFSGMLGVTKSGVGAMFLFSHPWTAILMTISGLVCLSVMGLSLGRTLRLAGEGAQA
jgi:uncharacterized membrane protein YbhN (UPF0104 family)